MAQHSEGDEKRTVATAAARSGAWKWRNLMVDSL
jgi:hypothetical protein